MTQLLSPIALHLWQSTLFAVVAALAATTLLRDREACVRHAVWAAASLKFLVPFAGLMTLGASLGSLFPYAAPMPEPIRAVLEQTSAVPARLMPQGQAAGAAAVSILPLLLTLWAAGVIVVLCRWTREWRQVDGYTRGATWLTTVDGVPVLSSNSQSADAHAPSPAPAPACAVARV
jgi:bla regulator protein BlaR1